MVIDLFIDLSSTKASQNAPRHHQYKKRDGKSRNRGGNNRIQQTGNLGKQYNIQGILRRCLGWHGKKEKQHYQVDRPSQKRRHHAENKTHQQTNDKICHPQRFNPGFIYGINQRSQSYREQAARLDRSHIILVKGTHQRLKQTFSKNASYGRPHGERRSNPHIHKGFLFHLGNHERICTHGKNRTA